jgi:hypothetical protein
MKDVKRSKEAYLGRGRISHVKMAGKADVDERSRNPSLNDSNKVWIKYTYTLLENYTWFYNLFLGIPFKNVFP